MKRFSLFSDFEKNLKTLEDIYDAVKITLGPTGKNGIVFINNKEIKFLTSGSLLLKSLEFPENSKNVIVKLLEQSSIKTFNLSGDGSTTTTILSCELLKVSLKYLINGYNSIYLSNGLKKLSYFFLDKVTEYSIPIKNNKQLEGVLKTAAGKKINSEILKVLDNIIVEIKRDGLILIEENASTETEVEAIQGLQLERGYASSYFVNDLKKFEVIFENPYIFLAHTSLESINQIYDIIEFVKKNNKPLVIVAEEFSKEFLSTCILNSIQKKLKIVVIKYTSIKFLKTGILEDLATLTYAKYSVPTVKKEKIIFSVEDLGQAEKVIISKEKSTFLFSKFSNILAKRKINELNRELLTSESEDEKFIFKTRIGRLSGNIVKLKIGNSNQYELREQRQKVENLMNTIRSVLEEGILPGGGVFYFYLREEMKTWSAFNLIGEEIFANNLLSEVLGKPFEELFFNANLSFVPIISKLNKYPLRYDLVKKEILNELEEGVIDSSKSVRSILWNSISLVSTIITSE
jgi:chaperonin GroEL